MSEHVWIIPNIADLPTDPAIEDVARRVLAAISAQEDTSLVSPIPSLTDTPTDDHRVGYQKARFDWVPAASIAVDEDYQRGLNEQRVNAIVREFDADVFNVITVSEREDGTLYCLDGQHRVAASLLINAESHVPAFIYAGLTGADEARIFYKMNRFRLTPTSGDAFKARLLFGDPVAVAVKQIVDRHGLIMRYYPVASMTFEEVQAVSELERLYKMEQNGALLDDVLWVIGTAWNGEKQAHRAAYMRGIAYFLKTFSDPLSQPRTKERMMQRVIDSVRILGPEGLERRAAFYRETLGSRSPVAMARAIHAQYQKNLPVSSAYRLPVWGAGDQPEEDTDA